MGPTLVTTRSLPSGRTYAPERSGSAVPSQSGVVESLRQCVVAIDGLVTVEGSGGIEQAMKAVAQECWQFLSMHGGRFSCMQALETKLLVPRVDAVRVLEWFLGIKQFLQIQQVAQILSHGVQCESTGLGT